MYTAGICPGRFARFDARLTTKEVAKLCGISKKEMRKINQTFGAQAHWGAEQKPKEESV